MKLRLENFPFSSYAVLLGGWYMSTSSSRTGKTSKRLKLKVDFAGKTFITSDRYKW